MSTIHSFDADNSSNGIAIPAFIVMLIGIILLGTFAGYGVAQMKKGTATNTTKTSTTTEQKEPSSKSAGIADKNTFKDKAEGILREGGFEDEGNFHLERPGGKSQNAYLTSTTVDLSEYIGKKVEVWGQTYKGQKAGWLMDVGYVEVE